MQISQEFENSVFQENEECRKRVENLQLQVQELTHKLKIAEDALNKYASGTLFIGCTVGLSPDPYEYRGDHRYPIGYLAERTLMKLEDK